jgi:hypothetical protein
MTAKEKYKQTKAEINMQIKMLKEAIDKHSKDFGKDQNNWGYVGDLNHIKSTLGELDGFLKSVKK